MISLPKLPWSRSYLGVGSAETPLLRGCPSLRLDVALAYRSLSSFTVCSYTFSNSLSFLSYMLSFLEANLFASIEAVEDMKVPGRARVTLAYGLAS